MPFVLWLSTVTLGLLRSPSAFSLCAKREGIAWGLLPVKGPDTKMIVLPLFASNCGVSFSNAALKPPEIMTVTSLACRLVSPAGIEFLRKFMFVLGFLFYFVFCTLICTH